MTKDKSPKGADDSGNRIKKNNSPNSGVSSVRKELEALSRQELVEIASNIKIKNYSRLSKAELVKMISQAKTAEPKSEKKINGPSHGKKQTSVPTVDSSHEKKFETTSGKFPEGKLNDNNEAGLDLKALSREELVDTAKELKIKNYSRLNKTRLVKLISEAKALKVPAQTFKKKLETESNDKISAIITDPTSGKTKTVKSTSEKENLDSAGLIERIAQHLKSPYVDEREAKSAEDRKIKFLLRPSKYPKGKINQEYLFDDEVNLELPDLYEENKIVLLPVDPFRVYTYWNLNLETLRLIEQLNLQQLLLKVNDVTNIVYNGKNAVHYWFESCIPQAKNWYIYLLDGNKNLKVELGYVIDGKFNIIATSNTIYVPRRNPSPFVEDKFVIVTYPEAGPKKEKAGLRLPSGKTGSYYRYDDQSIAESFNTRRLSNKMPVFAFNEEIPDHFAREYEITGPVTGAVFQAEKPTSPIIAAVSPPGQETIVNAQPPIPGVVVQTLPMKESRVQSPALIRSTFEEIPLTIKEQFEYFSNVPGGKVIVDRYYYEIPGQKEKIIKVSYQWFENSVPYSKEYYWSSEVVPQIHEKIYKVSWGPTWVKEYIGGSEQIRFIGASERFLGGSEMFIGGSERYFGGSEQFFGGSDIYLGGSELFMGGSERYIGGSEKSFIGGSEMFIGGSEQFLGASEMYIRGI